MRFASLGSGSEGNGLLVEVGATRVLIDCGFGVRDTVARLARIGVAPETVTAIIVTHEHSDHICGVAPFAGRFGTPVWLTFGTLETVAERFAVLPHVYGFDSHDVFEVGDIEVRPFPVPHDAREPVQFVCSDGDRKSTRLNSSHLVISYAVFCLKKKKKKKHTMESDTESTTTMHTDRMRT